MSRIQYTPSGDELDVAKQYLTERLKAENSMASNLRKVMDWAAARIVQIAYNYNTPLNFFSFSYNQKMKAEIDEVIVELVDHVEDYIDTLATYHHEDDNDEILAFIHRENHNKTLNERLRDYADKYKNELEIGLIAAMYLKKSSVEALTAIKDNMQQPFKNSLVVQAIKAGRQIDIPNYGRGRTNSMLTALTNLSRFAVAEGWMHGLWIEANANDAVGFVTFRGSTYPCDMCDDYAGWIHPMDDPMPPIHSHCVCGAVFVYQTY